MPPGQRYELLWQRKMAGSKLYMICIESSNIIKDTVDGKQHWREALREMFTWNSMLNIFHLHRQTTARHPAAHLDVQSES